MSHTVQKFKVMSQNDYPIILNLKIYVVFIKLLYMSCPSQKWQFMSLPSKNSNWCGNHQKTRTHVVTSKNFKLMFSTIKDFHILSWATQEIQDPVPGHPKKLKSCPGPFKKVKIMFWASKESKIMYLAILPIQNQVLGHRKFWNHVPGHRNNTKSCLAHLKNTKSGPGSS